MSALDWRPALYWLGVVALSAWLAWASLVALLSPLYTVGGVDEGWWLVAFHWACVSLAAGVLFFSLRAKRTGKLTMGTVLLWATPGASYAMWIGFYVFYNRVLLHCEVPCGGVSLPG